MSSIIKAVAEHTGTRAQDWYHIGGIDTRCGVDYWFEHRQTKRQVYVNEDQGEIMIEVLGDDQN